MGRSGGTEVSATFKLGEFHEFSGGGRRFLYTVPSAGIFELDDASAAVLALLAQREATRAGLSLPHNPASRRIRRSPAAAARQFPFADDGDESHQSVQFVVPVLLRIR